MSLLFFLSPLTLLLLAHQTGHLLRFLLLLQLLVILNSRSFSCFSQPFFLLEFLLFLLLFHVLDSVQSLDQSSYFSFLITLEELGNRLIFGPSDLLFLANFYLFDCFEG